MNIKLLLSGILLLSILAACSDRDEEGNSYPKTSETTPEAFKAESKQGSETAKKIDSTKTKEIIDAPQAIPADISAEQAGTETGDTIDPTKPDRPK